MGHQRTRSAVTPRALAVALCFLLTLPVIGFYVEIAWNRVYQFWGVPSLAPVLVLVLLGALGSVRWLKRLALSRRELLAVYAILLVASPVVGHGMLFWLIPKVVHYYYLARAIPEWQTAFLPYLPSWFGPSDFTAVNSFFDGRAAVPWPLWWLPLAAWLSFLFALMGASWSTIALLQRQWISNERLTFPLAQIPLTLVPASADRDQPRAGRLTASRIFWVGAGIAFAVALLNGLSDRWPAIPAIPLGPTPIMLWQRVGPLAGLGEIDVVLWPWLIALAFLIPTDLSFSCWFFWLLRVGLTVLAITFGHAPQLPEEWWESAFPAPYNQCGGAMFAMGLWALCTARPHLSRAARIAFSRRSGVADADEVMPYRWMLIVFLVCCGWMIYFLWLAGCRIVFGTALVLMILAFYVVWAKLRAETGLGFINMPFEYQMAMGMPFGDAALRPTEVVALLSARWAYYPSEAASFDVCAAGGLEALKTAEVSGINRRRLGLAIAVAFVLSVLIGSYITLAGTYHYGYLNLAMGGARGQTWPSAQPKFDGERIFQMITTPGPRDLAGLAGVLAGAVVAVTLGVLRLRFTWWPFHPMGYMAANIWGMHWFYMPFLVGWAAKVLVLRYGGLRLYRSAVPLATGIIVGDMLSRGVWVIVAFATRGAV